jgi:APA family basic amino acid/polyamine antiporter
MWLRPAIKLAIIAGYTSVILVMLLGQSRVFFSMSRDALLPRLFSDVHPKFRTPWRSNLLFMVTTGAVAAFAPISVLGEMTSIGTLFAFVLVCIGVIIMRRTHPGTHRPFKTPGVPVVPILGVGFNLVMMYFLGWTNWLRLFIWMAIGLFVYFNYSQKRSLVQHPEPAQRR